MAASSGRVAQRSVDRGHGPLLQIPGESRLRTDAQVLSAELQPPTAVVPLPAGPAAPVC